MALTKVQAEGVNLADNFAFTGTVTGTVSGTNAFSARASGSSWVSPADGTILIFSDDSTGDSFDTDSCYNTSTYKFTAPASGVYMFWYVIYTAESDSNNGFSFLKNSTKVNFSEASSNKYFSYSEVGAGDHIQTASIIIPLSSSDTMAVCTATQSGYYQERTQWGGCRLA
tara:strand:- start:253 stop:762 length:510 start_codon:yes stop_codon:yes gene_type:complete